jgi:GrpB-like predicted nucleotidyltransferase (UPF0157 family)
MAVEITHFAEPNPDEDPWVVSPPATEPVAIIDYEPSWADRYAAFAEAIRGALGDTVLGLEHVGSTAVPGLAAKDVIDIDLTVLDPRDETEYVPRLEAAGWQLTVREPSWYEHRCLRFADPRANLHVFGPDCPEAIRHVMFRDWLRSHPDDRERYARAKRAAVPGGGSVMDYNLRKQTEVRAIYDRLFRSAGLLRADHSHGANNS